MIKAFSSLSATVADPLVYADAAGDGVKYDYRPVCLCIIYCFVSSFVGNYIVRGAKSAYKFTIITSHPEELVSEIKTVLRHGATLLPASGAYSGDGKTVILCVINKNQITDLRKMLEHYKDTFSFLTPSKLIIYRII